MFHALRQCQELLDLGCLHETEVDLIYIRLISRFFLKGCSSCVQLFMSLALFVAYERESEKRHQLALEKDCLVNIRSTETVF